MKIVDDLTSVNYDNNKREIKYIVVHYTGNKGDTAAANTRYFRTMYRGASAHYFVDENEVRRCVPDNKNAWAVGAHQYKHKDCRNNNSISVELCTKFDGEYYFDDRTVANAIELIRELMKKYNIGIENVLRHYDVTGKSCPRPLLLQSKWEEFCMKLIMNKCTINKKSVDSINYLGYNYIKVRDLADILGLEVSFDTETKEVTLGPGK